jgi:hypothetical protein
MNPDEAVAAARFVVKHGHVREQVPREVVGVLLGELDARGVAIERVRELHSPTRYTRDVCEECDGRNWPCPTIQALDGQP